MKITLRLKSNGLPADARDPPEALFLAKVVTLLKTFGQLLVKSFR